MTFRAYIVEDSPTIRENLIETLQELALVEPVGTAETETRRQEVAGPERRVLGPGHHRPVPEGGQRPEHPRSLPPSAPDAEDGGAEQSRDHDVRWRCAQLGADAVFDKSTEIDALVEYCVRERVKVEPEY